MIVYIEPESTMSSTILPLIIKVATGRQGLALELLQHVRLSILSTLSGEPT